MGTPKIVFELERPFLNTWGGLEQQVWTEVPESLRNKAARGRFPKILRAVPVAN
jgi:hypothetical protein